MAALLLLLLSHFSRVQLCATPKRAAHQAPPSLGFSRQEHWNELLFPSPMHESEKWKWSRSVVSDSSWPHGLQPTRLLHPWDFPGRVLEWGAIAVSSGSPSRLKYVYLFPYKRYQFYLLCLVLPVFELYINGIILPPYLMTCFLTSTLCF